MRFFWGHIITLLITSIYVKISSHSLHSPRWIRKDVPVVVLVDKPGIENLIA